MKTRKVGKIVSLLVAIVLVATIMIPAASVLADSTKYAGVTWTEVSDYDSLRKAVAFSRSDETTYIKIQESIQAPSSSYTESGSNYGNSKVAYFIGEVLVFRSAAHIVKQSKHDEGKLGDSISAAELKSMLENAGYDGVYTGTRPFANDGTEDFVGITFSKYNIDKLNANFCTAQARQFGNITKNENKWDDNDTPSYEETFITIPAGANVVIDLNGKTIRGSMPTDQTAYGYTPSYSAPVFLVKGDLTVVDLSGENGQISGGTGYIGASGHISANGLRVYNHYNVTSDFTNVTADTDNIDSHDTIKVYRTKNARIHLHTKYDMNKSDAGTNTSSRLTYWLGEATESRGGGVYVDKGGKFTLESGSITGNCSWMETNAGDKSVFSSDTNVTAVAKGGGVYVESGGEFTMTGGEITSNVARAFHKKDTSAGAKAYGGGVYLENGAKMTMTGGKIVKNASYAEKQTNSKNDGAESLGAGIYIESGSVCNIIGAANAQGETTEEQLTAFPQITNNCAGAETRGSGSGTIAVKGGGVYCAGTLNIKKASITANEFAEAYNDLASSTKTSAGKATHVMRDEYIPNKADRTITNPGGTTATLPGTGTGLALYILDYNEPGPEQTPKTYITRLDPRFKDNLELATELVAHESSGVYGTGRGKSSNDMITDGAGVCMATTGTINIGERVWIYDNYDLVTTGHKAFEGTRNFRKYWVQEYTYYDAVAGTDLSATDAATSGKKITDTAGRYVYFGDNAEETKGVNNGYCWSDTRDDVYLPEGVAMYKGGSLFECRIGVNYYNMVNADGAVSAGAMGQAGNRVIVKSSSNLDPEVWGVSKSTPSARDIQFFYLNDNNKNYEAGLVDSSTKYTLPANKKPDDVWLCNPSTTATYNTRDRVAAVKADAASGATGDDVFDDAKKVMSPYEGYVNYSVAYPANTWIYHKSAQFTDVKKWNKYSQPTFRISDPGNYPGGDDVTVKSFNNAIVNLPQRAYQLTDEMIAELPEAYRKAKYMDYKVVYDNNGFGTESEPVLRFGQNVDREMYFTVDFDEANVHYYGESGIKTNLSTGTSIGDVAVNNLNSSNKTFVPGINSDVYFYKGSSNPQGTVSINPIVPDYAIYKNASVLQARTNNRSKEETSITKTNGIEDADLYFKGWSQYVSYGYKDDSGKVVNASVNAVPQASANDGQLSVSGSNTINGITALNYHNSKSAYVFDLSKIYNPNVNAQPCFSLTATWYTKEELAEARLNISNVKYQIVKRDDGTDLLRAVAIAGSKYEKFDAVGFVISTSNATPTIEGGYDYVTNDTIYERLGVKVDGEQKCYDVDQILGGKYYDEENGGYHSGIPIEKYNWTFADGTVGGNSTFAANVSTGNYKKGYKDAGLFYTNIIITDANRNTVYFVTPYAKMGNTYYYGESRAICYADYAS